MPTQNFQSCEHERQERRGERGVAAPRVKEAFAYRRRHLHVELRIIEAPLELRLPNLLV